SPEQLLGRELDHRSDIFSLGVVLYELVSGQKPFLGKTVGEIINSVVNRQPDSLGLQNPIFSPALDGIIFKCLEKEPANRYADARQLASELTRLRDKPEHASATAAHDKTLVVRTSPSAEPQVEPTKLWQLASKSIHPVYRSTAILLGWVILLVAAAAGFFL